MCYSEIVTDLTTFTLARVGGTLKEQPTCKGEGFRFLDNVESSLGEFVL